MRLAARAASCHVQTLLTRFARRSGVVRAFGIGHVERKGHRSVHGLAHCSADERRQATSLHVNLYRGDERQALVRIEQERRGMGSLAVPGHGVALEPAPVR